MNFLGWDHEPEDNEEFSKLRPEMRTADFGPNHPHMPFRVIERLLLAMKSTSGLYHNIEK